MLGVFYSCGKLFWREVKCRDFEFQDELKWYAGNIGDTITLSNKENEKKEFIVIDKYIYHRTKYISDTGCDCHDIWGIVLSAEKDTIGMYSHSFYIEKNKAEKYDYFYIRLNNQVSFFKTENKSIISNYSIGDKQFAQVLIFELKQAENYQINKVVVAPEIGVIELTETNGNVWKNTNLETKLNIDISSFDYSENVCN
jgi:hypothetical protein